MSRPQPFGSDAGERKARESHYRKPRRLPQPVNLPVLALAKHDLEPGLIALVPKSSDLCRPRGTAVDHDRLLPFEEIAVRHFSGDLRDVHLWRRLARMQEPVGEISVVRQEQRAARVEIETPDRDHPRADALQVLGHGGTSLGVLQGAHDIARLVEDQVHEWLGLDAPAVHFDPGVLRIRPRSELRHDLAVDGNPTRRDQLLGLSP